MARTDPAGAVMGKPAAGTDMKNRRGAVRPLPLAAYTNVRTGDDRESEVAAA